MGTGIEWTDETWNPVTGCTKVSPGCDHCYAETIAHRFAGTTAFPNGFDVTLHPDRLDQPLRWRKPRRVFVNSMSDLFHDAVPDEYIARVFAVMAQTPKHTYQILTKRHARMRAWLTRCRSWEGWITHNGAPPAAYGGDGIVVGYDSEGWPLPNVWLGVSVETQQWADIRVPVLLDTPAAVRFLSCEPLLGPVDLTRFLYNEDCPVADPSCEGRDGDCHDACERPLDWVIVGGESGPGARPMHPEWARSLRDQCTAAGVPFFFKQWGEWQAGSALPPQQGVDHVMVADGRHEPWTGHVRDDGAPGTPLALARYRGERGTESAVTLSRVGKKAAGRELDGREWSEYPQAVTA